MSILPFLRVNPRSYVDASDVPGVGLTRGATSVTLVHVVHFEKSTYPPVLSCPGAMSHGCPGVHCNPVVGGIPFWDNCDPGNWLSCNDAAKFGLEPFILVRAEIVLS